MSSCWIRSFVYRLHNLEFLAPLNSFQAAVNIQLAVNIAYVRTYGVVADHEFRR